jgi:pimeloyl-ACP methyl ester carboxylesterase
VSNQPGVLAGLHIVELPPRRAPSDAAEAASQTSTRQEAGLEFDSPTVIFVHGSLDRSTSFMRTARRLEDLAVVIYDRRGYSRSRALKPVATDIETHVEDLFDVIAGRQVVVVGHSLGGLIALAAAQRDPDLVRAVGAFEAPLPWYDWWPNRSRAFISEDPGDFAQGFFERVAGAGSWARLSEKGKTARRADGPALVAELAAIRADRALVDLELIRVPTFAGRGSKSLEHHRHAAGIVAQTVPGAQLIEIEGAAHGAHLTHPDAFATMVRSVVGGAR